MKIFEVGCIKTGTSSLGKAFEILGFSHIGWDEPLYNDFLNNRWDRIFRTINEFEAFEDLPWQDIDIKILDKRFPNSKFIYLERDDSSWLKSLEHHQTRQGYPWDESVAKEWQEKKKRKLENLSNYFSNRKNDLLVMKIQEGWAPLCKFLGQEEPEVVFPWLNKTKFSSDASNPATL